MISMFEIGARVEHCASRQTMRVVRVRTVVDVDLDGLEGRDARQTYAAESLRALDGPPRSSLVGTSSIVHVVQSYPHDMGTRCGLPPAHAFPAVTKQHAALPGAWRGLGLAICVHCAAYPFAIGDGVIERATALAASQVGGSDG